MANAGKTVIVAALDGTFQRKARRLVPGWDQEGREALVDTGGQPSVPLLRHNVVFP